MSIDPTMAVSPASLARRDRIAGRLCVLTARLMSRQSPDRIARILRRLGRGARPATYEEASRARAIVTSLSLVCTGPKGCLPRSIATSLLCLLRGGRPTWCVGVRVTPPFGAHAWVVAEGREVDEPYPPGYHRVLVQVGPETEGRT